MTHEQKQIEALLKEKIGLKKGSISSRQIAKALEIRRLACDVPDLASYLLLLLTSSQEWWQLIDLIVVPETWFFRHREAFRFLQDYVTTQWLKNHPASILRVLSLPCSTGEEPYSIAISLLEAGLKPEQFQIEAIDISPRALEKAKIALYGGYSFREDYAIEKSRYFHQVGGAYQLNQLVRETVQFKLGNLLEFPLPTKHPYHIIFCRHLLIYLDLSARFRAIDLLERLLVPRGFIFVGSPETYWFKPPRFQVIDYPYAFVYQKGKHQANPKKQKPEKLVSQNQITQLSVKGSHQAERKTPNFKTDKAISPVSISANHTSPKNQLLEARKLADSGALDQAASLGKKYLHQAKGDPQAYLLLGQIYQAKGDEEQAEEYFQKVIYLDPKSEEALIHLALIKESRGDLSGASLIRQRIQRLIKVKNNL